MYSEEIANLTEDIHRSRKEMLAPTQVWAFLICMDIGVWRYLSEWQLRLVRTSFYVPTKTQQIMEYPIQHSISKVGLPLIVTADKPNLCFLIDTGATHNMLFSFVYEHLKQSFTATSEKNIVMGIDGEKKETMQMEANLSFGGQNSKALFSVIDTDKAVAQIQSETGIQIHGILGIPFLIDNKWILDFNNLKIKSA